MEGAASRFSTRVRARGRRLLGRRRRTLRADVEILNLCRSYQYLSRVTTSRCWPKRAEHRVLPSLRRSRAAQSGHRAAAAARVGVRSRTRADARGTPRRGSARRRSVHRCTGRRWRSPSAARRWPNRDGAACDAGYAEVHCCGQDAGSASEPRAPPSSTPSSPLLGCASCATARNGRSGRSRPRRRGSWVPTIWRCWLPSWAGRASPSRRGARPDRSRTARVLVGRAGPPRRFGLRHARCLRPVAHRRGLVFEQIGRDDLPRLAEYDALFTAPSPRSITTRSRSRRPPSGWASR